MMRWNAILLSFLLPTMAHAFGGSLDGIGEADDPFGFCLTEGLNLVEPRWCDGSGSRTGGGSSGSSGGSTSGEHTSGGNSARSGGGSGGGSSSGFDGGVDGLRGGNGVGQDFSSYIDTLLSQRESGDSGTSGSFDTSEYIARMLAERSSGSSQTGNNDGGDYSSYINSLLQEKRARSGGSSRNGGMNGLQGSTGADSALVDTDDHNIPNRTETVQGTDPLDSFDPSRRIDQRIALPSSGVDMEGIGTPLQYLWRVREFFGRLL